MPHLQTNRLHIRGLDPSDDQPIFALRSNPQVNTFLDRKPAEKLEDAQNFIQNILANQAQNQLYYWGITLSEDQSFIGTICLFDVSEEHHSCEIGFELLPEFQGKGLMHEAANEVLLYAKEHLNMLTIKAVTHRDNISSIKLLEKLNFHKNEKEALENDLVSFFKSM